MIYSTEGILQTLRSAREQSGLSQRDLSARIGVPQSHISKIESGATDLRLSSLIELARALDHELVLVPRKALAAVEAIVSNATLGGENRRRSAAFNRAEAALAKLRRDNGDAFDFTRLDQTLRELANFRLSNADLDTLSAVTDRLMKLPAGPGALPAIERASKTLRALRNRIAHATPEAPRPAYALDDEDDDA